MDEVSIQSIIDRNAISILKTIDPNLVRLEKLQSILVNIYSPISLLLNKKSRAVLLDLLPAGEAKHLLDALGVKAEDTFSAIKQVNFKIQSNWNSLLAFLEVENSPAEESREQIFSKLSDALYPLFSHQRKAIKELSEKLYKENKRVLLHMPTGSGKTRTAMNVICDHLRANEPCLIVWFANTEELCQQAFEELENAWSFLGNRQIPIIKFWGGSNIPIGDITDGVIIAGLAKTYSLLKSNGGPSTISKIAAKATLVVMDEAHMAIAPTYKDVLNILTSREASFLGLSATPGRTWNNPTEDEELSQFFNRKKVTLKVDGYTNPVDYLVQEGYLAKVTNKPLLHQSGLTLSESDFVYLKNYLQLPERVLQEISEDKQRNILILQEIESLILRHNRIILFSINVNHSDLLATVLQARNIEAYSLTSNTEPTLRKKIIERYKSDSEEPIVLCNYGILTTGFDAPKTSCALVARPTDSLVLYSQMVGRAIRGVKAGGNKEAEIVTVIDTALPGFDHVATAFFNWEDVWE